MKTLHTLFAALCLFCQAALAAPTGWYQLDATWRDGQFTGRFHYDASSPNLVTAVAGTLADLAQTTAIDQVVTSLEDPLPQPWIFLANSNPAEPGGHDAGFYLYLLDLGATLSLDTAQSNGLYDWSSDFAFYTPTQLDDSPLLAYSIAPIAAVPEPAAIAMLLAGLALLPLARRRARVKLESGMETRAHP